MTGPLLIFEDATSGKTVYLPAENVAFWTLSRMGLVTLYVKGGYTLHPTDTDTLLDQLAPPWLEAESPWEVNPNAPRD